MTGFKEEGSPVRPEQAERQVLRAKLRLGPGGRIVIPAAIREAMGVKKGDILVSSYKDGELRLMTAKAAIERAQAIVRQYVPEGVSLVDEFLAGRRRMWGEDD
jgi:AbrB family looped-hinge helix DNA binding protein